MELHAESCLFADPIEFLAKLLIFISRMFSSNLSSYGMHIKKKCTRIFCAILLISDKLPFLYVRRSEGHIMR